LLINYFPSETFYSIFADDFGALSSIRKIIIKLIYMNTSGAKKMKSISSRILILALFLVAFTANVKAQPDAVAGQALFESKCLSCHAIDEKVVGPALRDVHEKRTEEWLVKWIRNNEALIKSGDKDAIAIFNDFGGLAMNNFESLSEDDVKNIIEYIATAPVPVIEVLSTLPTGGEVAQHSFYNSTVFWFLIILALLLLGVTLILKKVRDSMKTSLLETQPESVRQTLFNDRIKPIVKKVNPTIVILGVLVLLAMGVLGPYFYKYGMDEVGVQKGYAPAQPIEYSHKLHAGDLGIDCKYCHVGAEKGKNATIPSLNTCMNCHKGVQAKKPEYGGKISPEIQKIYDALDYDASRKVGEEYGPNPTNIKWVRIHNLPDLAYFNHSQHVKVGGIECQKCHGPVEKMEVVQQWNTLQMGWCIDCHRETGIDAENNDYYEKIHAIAKKDIAEYGEESKYWKDGKPFITEAMNGGLECSKCHY
jgi:mono/diheme cytochrome c family protein